MTIEREWNITCVNGHCRVIDAEELIEILEGDEVCDVCQCDYSTLDPDEIHLEAVCMHEQDCSFYEAQLLISENSCPTCEHGCGEGLNFPANFSIAGTADYAFKEYDFALSHKDSTVNMLRPKREDYWEFLVHYTTRENLIGIAKDQKIKARKTGFLGIPAVCLTETPYAHAAEIMDRFGEFGIVFKKSQIIKNGGAPVIYLPQNRLLSHLDKFPSDLKFLLSKVETPNYKIKGKSFDYLYEREWRIGKNVDFLKITPFGFIFPGNKAYSKFSGDEWEILMGLAIEYGDILAPK